MKLIRRMLVDVSSVPVFYVSHSRAGPSLRRHLRRVLLSVGRTVRRRPYPLQYKSQATRAPPPT